MVAQSTLASLVPPTHKRESRHNVGLSSRDYARLQRLAKANKLQITKTIVALLNFYDLNKPKNAPSSREEAA